MTKLDEERLMFFGDSNEKAIEIIKAALNFNMISDLYKKDFYFAISEKLFLNLQSSKEGIYDKTAKMRIQLKDKFNGFVGILDVSGEEMELPGEWQQPYYKLFVPNLYGE